jgi:hypothetical protein
MTASRHRLCILGAALCKVGLYLIGLAVVGQMLSDLFYVRTNDRLFVMGMAFFVTFALCRAFRAMTAQTNISFQYPAVG